MERNKLDSHFFGHNQCDKWQYLFGNEEMKGRVNWRQRTRISYWELIYLALSLIGKQFIGKLFHCIIPEMVYAHTGTWEFTQIIDTYAYIHLLFYFCKIVVFDHTIIYFEFFVYCILEMFPYKHVKRHLTIFNHHRIFHCMPMPQFNQFLNCFQFLPSMKNATVHVLLCMLLPHD